MRCKLVLVLLHTMRKPAVMYFVKNRYGMRQSIATSRKPELLYENQVRNIGAVVISLQLLSSPSAGLLWHAPVQR